MTDTIKIFKLEPAPVNLEEVRRWMGPAITVNRVGDKKNSQFVAYGRQKEVIDEVKSKVRRYASDKNFILVLGNEGIGKNEMFGRPFVQFLFKQKPAKKPAPPARQPQALPSKPSAPLVNTSSPIPPAQPVEQVMTKKPQQRYQEKNRVGWSKNGFQQFYAMTKPGGVWSDLKRGLDSGSILKVGELIKLFTIDAPYAPLVGLLKDLQSAIAHNDGPGYRKLITRIQPRLERLYDFARREALAKSIVMKSLGKRLI